VHSDRCAFADDYGELRLSSAKRKLNVEKIWGKKIKEVEKIWGKEVQKIPEVGLGRFGEKLNLGKSWEHCHGNVGIGGVEAMPEGMREGSK
jgi:hypothetical protein